MTDTATPTETGKHDESPATSDEYVDVPRCTVEALVKFADSEANSFIDIATTLVEVALLADPATTRDSEDSVQLPCETVEVFQTYFATFNPETESGYDSDDDLLMLDEEYRKRFDNATETARRALAEQ